MKLLSSLALVLLCGHAALGWNLRHDRAALPILPAQLSDTSIRALSLGDQQFLYRALVLQIQNAGDTGGRFTKMSDYNTREVVSWLGVLQRMDPRSSHYTALAVRYFSQIQQPENLRLLVDFVDKDVDVAPERKWSWQTQAVAMARDKVKDLEYALLLSRKMARFESFVPEGYMWMLQMEPVLLERLGRKAEAKVVMDKIVSQSGARMNDIERTWTKEFYERLGLP
jgi:hypothetical protein